MWLNLLLSWGILAIVPGICLLIAYLAYKASDESVISIIFVEVFSYIFKGLGYVYLSAIIVCLVTGILGSANAKTYDKLTIQNEVIEEDLVTSCYSFVKEASEQGTLEKPVDTIDDLFVFIEKHPSISRDMVVMELVENYKTNLEEQEILVEKTKASESLKSLFKCLCIFNFGI